MSKPKAPAPPDYAAAATAQGTANENSAIASNFLNQANQSGPTGSLTYTYDPSKGITLADGTVIPQATATTTLSPDQQKLYDQNNQMASALNDAAIQGIGYASSAANTPIDMSKLPALSTGGPTPYQAPDPSTFNSARDQVTNAMMQRLQPQMDQQSGALDSQLASQGIELGSKAYHDAKFNLGQTQNDQRNAALLAGDQEEQNAFNNSLAAGTTQFNEGLASNQFGNQARNQAMQEQQFLQTEPLNILNALRTGNQVSMPQFGNVTGGAQIAPAPVYQASQDQYGAQMNAYNTQMANYGSMLSGLASIGGAGIMASDRRFKRNIKKIGMLGKLPLYRYNYIWGGKAHIGVMADEVAKYRPDALGPTIAGHATVNYGVLFHG